MRRLGHLYLSVTLISLTVFSGLILSSSKASANTSASASVTVAAACSLNATTDSDHSANIFPGTYQSEIGSTTFTIVCNDIEGYSVYAVGYSNNEFGNNKLLANINGTLVPSYDISTGTNTSGTPSSWAMKLTPGTGLTTSNILNSYNNYNVIPNQYVKIATLIPATNSSTNNTTTFKSTYAANIATTQPAGTYAGKVKYTMVHPATNVPNEPKTCGSVCFFPNGEGTVKGVMGNTNDGSIHSYNMALAAPNFKREGYGFAGWSDKYDWVLNQNDEDGNGTGINDGYHIYGPEQIIAPERFKALYAVWVKSQGDMQNWNGCNAMKKGEVTALRDVRDNNVYTVAKLADGNCWMIENLRLKSLNRDDANTNSPAKYFQLFGGSSVSTWCGEKTATCIDKIKLYYLYNDPPGSLVINSNGVSNAYSMGSMFNWYTATAGNGRYQTTSSRAIGDICPKGWNLPTRDENGLNGVKLEQYPNNFVTAGLIFPNNHTNNRSGSYWTSEAMDNSSAYILSLNISNAYNYIEERYELMAKSTSNALYKYYGASVRCIAGP